MKMSAVSLVLWLVQLLTACALHHNATSTQGQDDLTSDHELTTENMISQANTATTTVPSSQYVVEEFLTQWTPASNPAPTSTTMQPSVARLYETTTKTQRTSTNAEGIEKSNNTTSINHSNQRFVSSPRISSSNPASTAAQDIIETGTRSGVFTTGFNTEGFTSQETDLIYTDHATGANNRESGTSLHNPEHTVQTTSSSWTEELSEATETRTEAEANGTTIVSLVYLRNNTTATLATPWSTPSEVDNSTTTVYTSALPSSKHGGGNEPTTAYNVETPDEVVINVTPTQDTSSIGENLSFASSLNTEEETSPSTTSANTVSTVHLVTGIDQNITENVHNTTEHNVEDTTTWTGLDSSVSTQKSTERLSVSPLTGEGSYTENFTTAEQNLTTVNYNTTVTNAQPTDLSDMRDGNYTTPGNSTAGMINVVYKSSSERDGQSTTGHYVTTQVTPTVTSTEGENVTMWYMEKPPQEVSTTTSASTASSAAVSSSQRNIPRNVTTYGDSTPSLSLNSTTFPVNGTTTPNDTEATSRNVSKELEKEVWTGCFSNVPSSKTRSSKLICFITLWSLGMIASIFFGLTVFLWVRLSIVRKKAKGRHRGVKSTSKERQSLWATHTTPAEERVEFWYANGSTLEADKKAREQERAKRNGGKQKEGQDGDMWIQPKVTTQDIAEFWYANRRGRNEERLEVQQDQL